VVAVGQADASPFHAHFRLKTLAATPAAAVISALVLAALRLAYALAKETVVSLWTGPATPAAAVLSARGNRAVGRAEALTRLAFRQWPGATSAIAAARVDTALRLLALGQALASPEQARLMYPRASPTTAAATVPAALERLAHRLARPGQVQPDGIRGHDIGRFFGLNRRVVCARRQSLNLQLRKSGFPPVVVRSQLRLVLVVQTDNSIAEQPPGLYDDICRIRQFERKEVHVPGRADGEFPPLSRVELVGVGEFPVGFIDVERAELAGRKATACDAFLAGLAHVVQLVEIAARVQLPDVAVTAHLSIGHPTGSLAVAGEALRAVYVLALGYAELDFGIVLVVAAVVGFGTIVVRIARSAQHLVRLDCLAVIKIPRTG